MRLKYCFNYKKYTYSIFFSLCVLFSVQATSKPQTTEEIYALAMIQIPIDAATDINVINEEGDTALHLAIRNNQFNTVHYLLNQGSDPNIGRIETTHTEQETTNTLQSLLEEHLPFAESFWKPNTLYLYENRMYEMSPFEVTIKDKIENIDSPILKKVLHLGCALFKEKELKQKNFTSQPQYTTELPLNEAMLQGNMKIISLLIKHGADVNGKSIARTTPIMATFANECTREETLAQIKYLVEQGANATETDPHWWILDDEGPFQVSSYVDIALHYKWYEIAGFFFQHGAQAKDKKGQKNWKKYLTIEEFPEFEALESTNFEGPFKIKNKPQAYSHRIHQNRPKGMRLRAFMFKAPSLGAYKLN